MAGMNGQSVGSCKAWAGVDPDEDVGGGGLFSCRRAPHGVAAGGSGRISTMKERPWVRVMRLPLGSGMRLPILFSPSTRVPYVLRSSSSSCGGDGVRNRETALQCLDPIPWGECRHSVLMSSGDGNVVN